MASLGLVTAVCRSETHAFSKLCVEVITLLMGQGVEGDAHCGERVKHRSRVAADPTQPNLRQVHLIHEELHRELITKGFRVGPGILGENITTRGVALLNLPRGTRLTLGSEAVVEVTGLRNPCKQLDDYQTGLMSAVLDRTPQGELIRKAGVMGIVIRGGLVRPGDTIGITLPDGPFEKLERV
ncbi:MAG: MOSC domain-containing protein [Alphaproteobacteria bacterium]|nr:MOSC domain-containing protein [Alphaproteobacteria bacterium]